MGRRVWLALGLAAAGCGRDCDLRLVDGHLCVSVDDVDFRDDADRVHFAVHVERDVAWALEHWDADASVLDGWEFEFHRRRPVCYFQRSDGCVEPWRRRIKILRERVACPTHILPHEIGHLTKRHLDPFHRGWGWARADHYIARDCDTSPVRWDEEARVRLELGLASPGR